MLFAESSFRYIVVLIFFFECRYMYTTEVYYVLLTLLLALAFISFLFYFFRLFYIFFFFIQFFVYNGNWKQQQLLRFQTNIVDDAIWYNFFFFLFSLSTVVLWTNADSHLVEAKKKSFMAIFKVLKCCWY